MGFARGATVLQSSSLEHENKLFVAGGGGAPFMASINNSNIMHQQTQHQQEVPDHHQHDQMSYGMMMQPITSSSSTPNPLPNFISKDGAAGAYDLGELDQALFLYLDSQEHSSTVQDQRQNSGLRPPTLNIFPSQPMHVGDPSSTKAMSTMGLVSPASSGSKRSSEPSMDLCNPNTTTDVPPPPPAGSPPHKSVKREGNGNVRKGLTSSSEHDGPKTPDPKTLRRLAQNREAARKSRLRKKAYVQQLETSRMKLTQLEQDLQRARAQGVYLGGGALVGAEQGLPLGMGNNLSSDAAVFDMEYGRWLEEHHRIMCELRAAVQEHLPENELRLFVDNCLAHFDEMMNLKSMVAKTDVFHLVSGTWKTPAERCFMWMGGFRPSDLIKIILNQIEPLTEQQLLGICQLQQSTQEAEDALSQGLDTLNQSLSDIIVSDSLSCPPNMANYMGQMAMAMNKLSTLEGFVRQADNLRHQTIHRLCINFLQLIKRQMFASHYRVLLSSSALSSLWMTRSRQD